MTRVSTVVMAVLGAVAVVLAGAVMIFWPREPAQQTQELPATVVKPADCGQPDARDVVELRVPDGPRRALLDGCGNRKGDVLTITAPDPLPAGEATVQLAGTGPSDATRLAQRLSAVLVIFAGLAGGIAPLLLQRRGHQRR